MSDTKMQTGTVICSVPNCGCRSAVADTGEREAEPWEIVVQRVPFGELGKLVVKITAEDARRIVAMGGGK